MESRSPRTARYISCQNTYTHTYTQANYHRSICYVSAAHRIIHSSYSVIVSLLFCRSACVVLLACNNASLFVTVMKHCHWFTLVFGCATCFIPAFVHMLVLYNKEPNSIRRTRCTSCPLAGCYQVPTDKFVGYIQPVIQHAVQLVGELRDQRRNCTSKYINGETTAQHFDVKICKSIGDALNLAYQTQLHEQPVGPTMSLAQTNAFFRPAGVFSLAQTSSVINFFLTRMVQNMSQIRELRLRS